MTTDSQTTDPTRYSIGFLRTTIESARQSLMLLRHRRALWLVPIALLVTVVLAFAIGGMANDRINGPDLFCIVTWWGMGTVIVPWVTLLLGVQAVHGELEDRTSQYLFLRPVHRVPLLLGKWLAASAVAVGIACAGAAALFVGLAARRDMWPDGIDVGLLATFCTVLGIGAVAYAGVAMLFGATFRRPLAWAAFFVVGVQMLAANLPVSAGMRQLTITDPLRRLMLDQIEPDRRLARNLWPAERQEAQTEELDAGAFELEAGSPLVNLLVFLAVCLAFAAWRYATTEYESRNRD